MSVIDVKGYIASISKPRNGDHIVSFEIREGQLAGGHQSQTLRVLLSQADIANVEKANRAVEEFTCHEVFIDYHGNDNCVSGRLIEIMG